MFIDQLQYFTFTCFDCSLRQIEDLVLFKWGNSDKLKITNKQFRFDLYELSPLKGGSHFEKLYFFMPKFHEDKCVMFSNYSDGLSSLVYQITFALQIKAYNFRITADNSISYAMNAFSFVKNGDDIRTVYTMKDPKWKFYSQGEMQWFEDRELYELRMIKKRLDRNILISYCSKLGFDISNDDFWESKRSILIERLAWGNVPNLAMSEQITD